jgi:hypothetical protein
MGYDVIQTNDNGYAVVGTTWPVDEYGCRAFLLKTDQNGNEEWMKTYGYAHWNIGDAVLQTNDNGYIIVGDHSGFGAIPPPPFYPPGIIVIRTDAHGDTLWTHVYDSIGGEYNRDNGYDICEGINGGFLISGYRQANPSFFGGGLVVRIDDNGDSLWTTTLPGAKFNSIIQASDNGYIAVGTKEWGGMNQFSDLCLAKINDSGVIEWVKNYGMYGSTRGCNEGHSVTQVHDGGYVAAGYSIPGEGIYIIRTDINGDSLWTKFIEAALHTYLTSFVDNYTIQQTPDLGYIVAGGTDNYWSWYPGDHHIKLVRLGPETGISDRSGTFNVKPTLFVRPTIFKRKVTIDYQTPYLGQGELNIYDITGRVVKTLTMDMNTIPSTVIWHGFNNNGLPVPNGTYYIVLQSGMHEVTQKIILIR